MRSFSTAERQRVVVDHLRTMPASSRS
jgi:hypothetical protein